MRIESDELAFLPWEFLFDGETLLGLRMDTPLVRYPEVPQPIQSLQVEGPLRILVVIASPVNYPDLNRESQAEELKTIFSSLQADGVLEDEFLLHATYAGLMRRLRSNEFHVLHYLGYSGFDTEAQRPVLLFEEENGMARKISGDELSGLLHREDLGRVTKGVRALRLVLINDCERSTGPAKNFSVGVGASYYDFSFGAVTDRYDFINDPFGPADYSAGNLFASQIADGSDSDWGYNVGFLWRASPKFQLGGVYRDGPSFDFSYRGVCGASDPVYCADSGNEFTTGGSVNVPTVYGLGIALKPSDALTLTVDWDRGTYSDLEKGFAYIPSLEPEVPNFSVDDADEYHFGLEYGFINMANPLLLRAGAWLDPAHATTYSGSDPIFRALWSSANSADDQWHYTGGLGLVLAQGKFQVDLAADISDRIDTYSLSGVYRF